MPKVFIVTTGSYSDYSLSGVFSRRELAESYMAKVIAANETPAGSGANMDFNDIEEWTVDLALEECFHTRWNVGIMIDNGEIKEGPHAHDSWQLPVNSNYIALGVPCYHGRDMIRAESVESREHALKWAAELRQQVLRERAAGIQRQTGDKL